MDLGSVKRWGKGSWEGRVRLSYDPLHKTIAQVVNYESAGKPLGTRQEDEACVAGGSPGIDISRLPFWRRDRLASNLLSAPSNPAGYAGYSVVRKEMLRKLYGSRVPDNSK